MPAEICNNKFQTAT